VDYTLVCKTLEDLRNTRKSVIGADVFMSINHYAEMLRRHIVSAPRLHSLPRRFMPTIADALDLIFEHRPDQQLEWRETLEK